MCEETKAPEAAAELPLPAVVETLTITVCENGSMNIASDPPCDRWRLIGLLTTLLKAL